MEMQSYNLEMHRRPAKRLKPRMPILPDCIPEPRSQVPVNIMDPTAGRPATLDAHCRESSCRAGPWIEILFWSLSNAQTENREGGAARSLQGSSAEEGDD